MRQLEACEANKWYQSLTNPRDQAMAKKTTEASTSGERGGEMAAPAPSLKLSRTNYRVWSMSMEVYLDSHDLWQAIVGDNVSNKKDRLALSTIISGIPEDMLTVLDAKKTAKENWEILRQRNLGVDRGIQSRIQRLKCDFEMLVMAKTDSVVDFAMKFTHIISDLRIWERRWKRKTWCDVSCGQHLHYSTLSRSL